MPKDRRVNSFSFNRGTSSPYSCSSKNSDLESQKYLPPVGNEREWEETRCPICMEHPHNAVLLLCSSRDKGCQPYMCDTSYRHSNCLDQFCKSSAVGTPQEGDNVCGVCPLCRGHVEGCIVVEAARNFMNSKTRSCALERCNFTGNYSELRNHARREHPSERPSEADPMRLSDWTRMELQRDFEDTFSNQVPGDVDDMLTELLDGHSESEEELDDDINMTLNFEFELSFSFPTESSSTPREQDGPPSYGHGGYTVIVTESSIRSQNRRSRRSGSGSDNNEHRFEQSL